MSSLRNPLILLADGHWDSIYGSIDEVVRRGHLEGFDVRDGSLTLLDAVGRVIALSTEKDWGTPIVARATDEFRRDDLERSLRELVADAPIRWGLIDGGADLGGLLRAVWYRQHPDREYPE
jgi:hypothetical protein